MASLKPSSWPAKPWRLLGTTDRGLASSSELGYRCFQMGDSTAGAADARAAARHARAIGDQESWLRPWPQKRGAGSWTAATVTRASSTEPSSSRQPEQSTILFFRGTFVHATIQLLTHRYSARQAFAEVLAQALQRGREAGLPIVPFDLVRRPVGGGYGGRSKLRWSGR